VQELKRYEEHNGLKCATHLEVSVYYTKGGSNFLSGGTTSRGYYLSVRPVTLQGHCVSFVMFTGRRKLLLETARFSTKQFKQAVEMAKGAEAELVAAVLAESQAA
jgi:hypothetical protein